LETRAILDTVPLRVELGRGVRRRMKEGRAATGSLVATPNTLPSPMSTVARYLSINRKRALAVLGAATVGFTVALYLLDPHVQGFGGTGISGFEFAGSRSRAAQVMAEWGAEGQRLARLGLLLDYGYMLSYGLFFALAGFAIRDTARAREWRRMARAGAVIPYFALAAACFDASENAALLLTLGGHGGSFAPPFATVCSSIKWTLISIAILYVLWGLVLLLRPRLRGSAGRVQAEGQGRR
jgi:hypothetical protein